ncbi:GreA/GreB family elongation factor [Nonlabens sp.]|uniref:GreA/GreB family elongation factor n=1 Tax=Nonlabens sp. TaxID=1888209 RepID=UPI00344E1610
MILLRKELDALEKNVAGIAVEDEKERRREQTLVLGRIKLLNERIKSARPILLEEQPQDEIRFGATVTVNNLKLKTHQVFTITGVDEPNVAQGKIAFTTPIARAIIGAKVGGTVDFKLGGENRTLYTEDITYGTAI